MCTAVSVVRTLPMLAEHTQTGMCSAVSVLHVVLNSVSIGVGNLRLACVSLWDLFLGHRVSVSVSGEQRAGMPEVVWHVVWCGVSV